MAKYRKSKVLCFMSFYGITSLTLVFAEIESGMPNGLFLKKTIFQLDQAVNKKEKI